MKEKTVKINVCGGCGSVLIRREGEPLDKFLKRKICGINCALLMARAAFIRNHKRVAWKCENCGIEKEVTPSFAALRNTCSFKCAVALFRKQHPLQKKITGVKYGYVLRPLLLLILCFIVFPVSASQITVRYTIQSKHAGRSLMSPAPSKTSGDSPAGVLLAKKGTIAEMVCKYFKNDCKTAMAVFKAESGLRANAMNWNCRYGDISTSCKFEDRSLAWSVDCGITQLNFPGQECPKEAFDAEWNIQKAYEWKYKTRGFQPWVAFTSGSYLQQL